MEKIFKLVKIFLRDRLKLEISEKKSKVVNLRKKYSYFLRVKFKALERTNKFTLKSYIADNTKDKIKQVIQQEIIKLQKRRTAK